MPEFFVFIASIVFGVICWVILSLCQHLMETK
jgi:hypothetical protein